MKKRVLILEDDVNLAESLAREFEDRAFEVHLAQTLREVPDLEFDRAIVDLRLKGESGLEAIAPLKARSPACRILVLTGYGSISTAVEAVKRGAVEYLTKPASFALIESALEGTLKRVESELHPPSLAQIEQEHIEFVLTRNQGNITKAAKELGLHRQSLQRKLKKYT